MLNDNNRVGDVPRLLQNADKFTGERHHHRRFVRNFSLRSHFETDPVSPFVVFDGNPVAGYSGDFLPQLPGTSGYFYLQQQHHNPALYEMEVKKKTLNRIMTKGSDDGNGDGYGKSFGGGSSGEGSSQSRDLDDDFNKSQGRESVASITSASGEKSGDADQIQQFCMRFFDDMRISKLLRRLCSENSPSAAIKLCEKLEMVILDAQNVAYIRRAFDFLAESLISVLEQGPQDALNEVAKVFGMFGYVMRHEFSIYKNWILKTYDSRKNIRVYLMRALKVTISLDATTLDLLPVSDRLIVSLKDLLEVTESSSTFIAVSDVIGEFAKNYKKPFEKHFTDVVDIVVGWHLETEQSSQLKQHCSEVLQQFSKFFIKDLDFTLGLLGQFLEDIAAFGEDIENSQGDQTKPGISSRKSPNFEKHVPPEISVGSFVGAFNSVLKCLTNSNEIIAFDLEKSLLEDAVKTITKVAYQSLNVTSYYDTVQSINEFLILILNCGENYKVLDMDHVIQIIELEIKNVYYFNSLQISSLLLLLVVFVKKLQTDIPIEFVRLLLEPRPNEEFYKLKMSSNKKHVLGVIKLYHEILNIKNVPLLQEAYRHILMDIGTAMDAVILYSNKQENTEMEANEETVKLTLTQAEVIVNFYLIAISVLATQTSSIIGMYALQPSILELLIVKLFASDLKFWCISPTLHEALIHLLAVHCIKNNNFVSTSNLLSTGLFSKLSCPSSDNLTIILKFFSEILEYEQLSLKSAQQLLDWLNILLKQMVQHATVLKDNTDFINIGKRLSSLSVRGSLDLTLKCAECVDVLLQYNVVAPEVLHSFSEVCYIHISSTENRIRDTFTKLFGKVPLSASLNQAFDATGVARLKDVKANELQHWYASSTGTTSKLSEKYFKDFIDSLVINDSSEFVGKYLKKIFSKCWTMKRGRSSEFFSAASSDLKCLIFWAQWEAAQYCVNSKLRTTLGKPQDTFLHIEAIIKEAAKTLAMRERTTVRNVKSLVCNQKHTRILLGFLECLEKAIYNAAEGTAFGIPAPEKPARTFFRLNSSTCNEWFNRIRHAIDLLAIHNMEPEVIIRCSELTLKNLVNNGKKNEPIFEHTIITYVRALLKCGESDNLYGLYVWVKQTTGKRLTWIKTAADQASGKRERAADSYLNILHALSQDEKTDASVMDFVKDQIIDCLHLTNQWAELKQFRQQNERYDNDSKESMSPMLLSPSHIDFLMKLEQGPTSEDDNFLVNLSNWEIFHNNENISNNFSYNKNISIVENTLASLIIKSESFDKEKWKICENIIKSGLQESLRTQSREHMSNLIILNHIAQNVDELNANDGGINLKSLEIDRNYGSIAFTRILRWIDYFSYRSMQSTSEYNNLRLDLASMARNEGNLKFARRELEKFFKRTKVKEVLCYTATNHSEAVNLERIFDMALQGNYNSELWSDEVLHGLYESSKWMFQQPEKQNDAIQLAATSCLMQLTKINENPSLPNHDISQRISRTLLKLSDWLSQSNDTILDEEKPVKQLLSNVPEIIGHGDEKIISLIPKLDISMGKLIQYSVKIYPDLPKAWGAMGNWYYRWGRKVVEARNEADVNKAGLGSTDIETIHKFVPNATDEDVERIVAVLNKHQVSPDDEEIGPNDASSTEIIESQLRAIETLANVNSLVIQSIVSIWRLAHKNVYIYYEIAADAYFKYLQLESSDSVENKSANRGDNTDCSVVTATLRLLRLIVKHALGLQDVLEAGLAKTPTRPWKVIIPQLFSRLNHHEPYVRKRVSELLCRVAKDSPHLIIFPAVVGAAQEKKLDDLCDITENLALKDDPKPQNTALSFCFNALLDTLSKQALETVDQVQLLVQELKRVTLLWDELWLHSLAQLYNEYSELFNTIEAEAHNTPDEKVGLLTDKHRILMTHVINDMKRLQTATSRPAETNFERNFQEKFSKIIEHAIEDLKKPFNREKPNESWQRIKQLYAIFQQKLQKSSHASLKMADISPILANMRNTAISMPGVETDDNKQIYIKSVDNVVHILQTKTKPKKLAFFGSDGKRYTYLFKGLEDLHLDERIMQFLSISNSMMSKSSDCNGNVTTYHAHHYSVIPLGPRSGLISWVDGVAPIFAVYKKWQQREAANPKKDKQMKVMRPSEMFYNKLTPLLAEHNLKTTDNRKQWPLSVLKQVLEELTNETPKDLLAKELWCCSTNAALWRQSIRNFSLCAAVMSVIGYVIGLGDRHLDNVLVKYTTGDIVHIDYNVCFEKGKTLRVPEKVPFRMTPNIEEALGITGIEGTFRLTCEHVLKTLRKERETLLTLLEAFVYDPLVDWAVGDDGTTANTRTTTALAAAADIAAIGATYCAGTNTSTPVGGATPADGSASASNTSATTGDRRQSRKRIENEAIRDTLASRFAEIKPEWTQYRDDVNEQLRKIIHLLDELDDERRQILADESQRDLLSKQMAMVREVETLGTAMNSHALSTLSQRYSVYRKAHEEFERMKNIVTQRKVEYQTKRELYLQTLGQIKNNELKELQHELDELCRKQIENEFDMVKEFLENSAQTTLYLQADQARKELDTSFLQQSIMVKVGIDALTQYESVMRYYPRSLHKGHRLERYANWLQELEDSYDSCRKIANEFPNMLSEDRKIVPENAVPYAYELEKLWLETNINLRKSYDILQNKFPDINKQVYQESLESISTFLCVEPGSQAAMKCVISASLCELNLRYIQFEEGCMKSIDGGVMYNSTADWILDKESTYLEMALELAKIFSQSPDIYGSIAQNIESIENLCEFIQCLKELEYTFQAHVMPTLLQVIISENEEGVLAIDELIKIQTIFDFDLLMNKLVNNIDCNNELDIVNRMYAQCKRRHCPGNEMGSLLDILENVFDMLHNVMQKCQNMFISYVNQNKFENLDHVYASREFVVHLFNRHSINNLRQRFEARKLQTILQTMDLAMKMSRSLRENDLQLIFDHSIILQPTRSLIYDYVQNTLLGLGSYFVSILEGDFLVAGGLDIPATGPLKIENLILLIVEENQANETFSLNTYSLAQTMCNNLSANVKEKVFITNIEKSIAQQNETLNLLHCISSVHYWLNESILLTQPIFNHITYRHVAVSTLKKTVHNLNAWKISIEKINNELMSFVQAVAQRLKWAAGANPALVPVQNAFNELMTIQDEKFKEHSKISTIVLQTSSAVLTYETFVPGSQELPEIDDQFVFLLDQFGKAYLSCKSTSSLVTPVEEALVRLLDPEGVIDHMWIENVSGLLDDMTDTVQTNIAELEKKLHATQDNLQMTAHKLRGLMENELRMDIRYLLKLILKIDGSRSSLRNKNFQSNYKQFLSRISDLHIKILSKDFTEENLKDIRESINILQSELDKIYSELLKLISNKNSQDDDGRKEKSEGKDASGTPVRDNKKGNQPEQKRNAYAVSVWRRIRMKLEGRDPDPTRRSTIPEQVDWMIREAMNPDNLAVLYEGWTPWV